MAKSSSFDKDTEQVLNQLKKELKKNATVQAAIPKKIIVKDVAVDEEEALLKKALQGVTPLKFEESIAISSSKPKKPTAQILARRAAATGADETISQGISDTQALLNPVGSEAFLSYRIATLQHRVFEQLKTGQLRWYEAVDLHGCSMEQAREAVLKLIDIAHQENQTVVKIVHGKGPQAILKTCVNGWLRQHRDVLAFVSAPSDQGGTGAVLVLLKRPQRDTTPENALHIALKGTGR